MKLNIKTNSFKFLKLHPLLYSSIVTGILGIVFSLFIPHIGSFIFFTFITLLSTMVYGLHKDKDVLMVVLGVLYLVIVGTAYHLTENFLHVEEQKVVRVDEIMIKDWLRAPQIVTSENRAISISPELFWKSKETGCRHITKTLKKDVYKYGWTPMGTNDGNTTIELECEGNKIES